mgnify:CR=1 FL=1
MALPLREPGISSAWVLNLNLNQIRQELLFHFCPYHRGPGLYHWDLIFLQPLFFDWLFSPIFIVMQAAPLAALIPLLVLAYGIGLTSKVIVVCIMAMPVIVLNTSGAVKNTPESLKEMGISFLASRLSVISRIIIPAASPVIFAGLRLGISAGFIGAILAELKITPTGVGDIITYSRSIADYPSMYAAIFSIIVLSVLFLNLLDKVETLLFKGNERGYVSD